jgi:hypothetical protein
VTDFAGRHFGTSADVNDQARVEKDSTYVRSQLEHLDDTQIATDTTDVSRPSVMDYYRF